MASKAAQNQYLEKIKPYKETIQAQLKLEEIIRQSILKDSSDTGNKRLTLTDELLFLASNYLIINGISQSILGIRNEEALNSARKSFVKAIVCLEEQVSPLIDVPFSDYEEKLAEISSVDAKKRFNLIKRIGLLLNLLKEAYGDNTKWKWAFVDLDGRHAAITKNIMNLKTAVMNTDPRSPDYEPTVHHLRFMKRLLNQAADRYRERYELSTNLSDDFSLGIEFLNALKRIHNVLGERTDAESVKKKADAWSGKLEADNKVKQKSK